MPHALRESLTARPILFFMSVEKEYLGPLAALTEQAPIVLEPWDPMGTLAR